MFGQPQDHTHGGPPRYSNCQLPGPPVGMTAGAPYQPPYARGKGGRGGRGPGACQPPPFPGPRSYLGYPPPNHGPPRPAPAYLSPHAGSPPSEAPHPPPSFGESGRSGPNCGPPPSPPTPRDAEMLKNIEILASFVTKNGPRFENMAREKQADNPKFAFLFGGQRGTEAAIGFEYYEWKKEYLAWEERSKNPSAEQTTLSESYHHRQEVGVAQLSHEVPRSPTGSDMDMEDDFVVTPTSEKKPASDGGAVVPSPKRERKSGFSSPVESPSRISERKIGPTSPGFERKSRFSSPPPERKAATAPAVAERTPQGDLSRQASEAKFDSHSSVPVDEEPSKQSSTRWTSAQTASSDSQYLRLERERISQGSDSSKADKEGTISELPRRRDSRRRTGFDRPCMEDVTPQSSPHNAGEPREKQRESAAIVELERKAVPLHGHSDLPTRPSRWGPPESGPTHHGNRDLVSDKGPETGETPSLTKIQKSSEASHQRREESLARDRSQSPRVSGKPARTNDEGSTRDTGRPKSGSVLDPLAVDEFGRLLRQGGSDSDGEGHHDEGKKRTRSVSRSRTRSPGGSRRKRWSPSRSPRRRGRRSRSWSSSPRKQRSRSRTPPRDGRWGGEARGERGFADRGGRRVGRGGGPQQACFDFAKGRCQRGASCRFLHEESNGVADDQGGRWNVGRGRGRGRGRSGRDAAEDADRSRGGKGGEQPRSRKSWNSNERNTDDDAREIKLIEELKKQEVESLAAEGREQRKGDAAIASGSTATGEEGSEENRALQSDKVSGAIATSKQINASSEYMCEALSPSIPSSQPNKVPQQTGGLSKPASSPQQPDYPTTMTHQYNPSLNVHLSQHPPFPPSSSSQPQQPTYSLSLSQPQQNVFPASQQSGFSPNVSNVPHNSGFTGSRPPQQPTFTPSPVSYSGNPSVPTQQPPPFASLPMLRSLPSYSTPQQQNFPLAAPVAISMPMSVPIPVTMAAPLSTGQGGLISRTSVINTPSQMLQMGPNLTTRLGYSWTSPGMGPPVSYGLPPQQPLQQPPPTRPQTQSVPSQAPPQVSVAQPTPYQYATPLIPPYGAASYSTLAAQIMGPASASTSDQYDPLSDSLEPGPPGAGDKKGAASYNQMDDGSRQSAGDQWKLQSVGETTPIMTNAGEVVLENVSPGLPGHMDNARSNIVPLANVSPRRAMHMVLENVSPTNVGPSFNLNTTSLNYGGTHQAVTMESVSPAPDRNPTGDGQKDPADGSKDQKKKDKESRILNLIRKSVAEHVKDLLKPTWKEGQMSKDAFKTIAKKAVDKVMGAMEAKGSIPKSQEKLDLFMETSKPKIAKLVQGYVDKYVKA